MNLNLSMTGILVTILVILAAASAVVSWHRAENQQVVSRTEYVKVPEIRKVEKIKRVEVPVERIVVLEKTAVAEKIELPPEVKQEETKQVTATAELPPHEGKTNVVSVVDTRTGETELLAKQEPLPFMDLESRKEIGIRYGFDSAADRPGKMTPVVFGRWEFLRIGNAHLGFYGEANGRGDSQAMVSLTYRW